MSSCCCPEKADGPVTVRCPASGAPGTAVEERTVKALLTERALQRFVPAEYRFCPDANCEVVYFSAQETRFSIADIRVAVWQKRPFGDRRVCYCFGESEASIREEIASAGQSSAIDRIREHIAAGRCACDLRNPRGACCLGEIAAAIARVETAIADAGNE